MKIEEITPEEICVSHQESVRKALRIQHQTIRELWGRLEQLEQALSRSAKYSSTSHKPPSSDITKAPKDNPPSDDSEEKKNIGAQPGRPKYDREAFSSEAVDHSRVYGLPCCLSWEGQRIILLNEPPRVVQLVELAETNFQFALEQAKATLLQVALPKVPNELDDNGKQLEREANNLANRFRRHGEAYFEFIVTPGIDPTNNIAEQAIRFVLVDRHITQGHEARVDEKPVSDYGQSWQLVRYKGVQLLSLYERQFMRTGMISHRLPHSRVLRDDPGFIPCERLSQLYSFLRDHT